LLLDKGYKNIKKELYYRCVEHDLIVLLKAIEDVNPMALENTVFSSKQTFDKIKKEGFNRACSALSPKAVKHLFSYSNPSKYQIILANIIRNYREASRDNNKKNKKLYKILCLLLTGEPKPKAPKDSLLDIFKNRDIEDDEYLLKVFELLIDNGADVNCNGAYALVHACSRNYLSIAKLLISKGSRVDVRDNHPVVLACRNNDLELLKYLVEVRGLSVKGTINREPLHMVHGNAEMFSYIKNALKNEQKDNRKGKNIK